MEVEIRTLPSIDSGKAKNLKNIDPKSRIIVQEKIDGSQFTVCRIGDEVHYYNKHKKKDPRGSPFRNSWLYLQGKTHFLRDGWSYHGEALMKKQANVVPYERCPFWIIYEIVRPDNTVLTPEEMADVLRDTPFEMVQILWDNAKDNLEISLVEIMANIMTRIQAGEIPSSLGGIPEGVVLKVLNTPKKPDDPSAGTKTSRFKFVRTEFKEALSSKRERLPEVPDEQFIEELGAVYNCEARYRKAMQHMQEDGKWNNDMDKNIHGMVDELDADLLKEEMDEIKTQLFIRFFPQISKAARSNVRDFLNGLKEPPAENSNN